MIIKTKIIALKKSITSNPNYPLYKNICIIYFSYVFFQSIFNVWGEHDFIGGLVKEFIALILYTILLLAWFPLIYICAQVSEQLCKIYPWNIALTASAGIIVYLLYAVLFVEIMDLISPKFWWAY
jgi:hypothetical protein